MNTEELNNGYPETQMAAMASRSKPLRFREGMNCKQNKPTAISQEQSTCYNGDEKGQSDTDRSELMHHQFHIIM